MQTEITFNIIFVRDTVPILSWMLRSLEAWSTNCRFRLVSNGCSESENEILRRICTGSDRFEFQQFSHDKVVEHGVVLTHLQRQETSPFFAFMDSDIFATGPFLPTFRQHLSSASAVFSCPPFWTNDEIEVAPRSHRVLHGEQNRWSDGFCLGGSYCAIYRNYALSQCIQEAGITFKAHWRRGIPERIRKELSSAGMNFEYYDTGKLLNILMGLRGLHLEFFRSKHLSHVGGISCLALRAKRRSLGLSRPRISTKLPKFALKLLRRLNLYHGLWDILDSGERDLAEQLRQRRLRVRSHFTRLLSSIVDGKDWPESFDDEDIELTNKVRRLEAHLRQAFAEYQRTAEPRPMAA